MSVLNCPVCSGAMREVARDGVIIDTCTQCRGVWLDRGELEKIAASIAGNQPVAEPEFLNQARDPRRKPDVPDYDNASRRRDHDDDDDDARTHANRRPQRSYTRSFLDFFD